MGVTAAIAMNGFLCGVLENTIPNLSAFSVSEEAFLAFLKRGPT
jgi:hypothetical protein